MGTRSYEFGKRLVAAGHEVTILTGRSYLADIPDEVDGMRIIQIPISSANRDSFLKRIGSFLLFSLRAVWQVLRLDYDLVYATSTPLTVGLPALFAKHVRGKRFIFEVRDLWPELPVAMGIIQNPVVIWLLGWFETTCYRSADACVGLSPGIVEGIRRKKPSGEVVLIPNGCDLEVFGKGGVPENCPPSDALPVTSDRLPSGTCHLPSDISLTALFCGAHGRANGLSAVLDAAEILKDRGRTDIQILFVGDGQLKSGLVERAREAKLGNCIFKEPMPKTELAQLMACCDVGLMILADIPAFRYGTSPNKFFDYIAAGLPVLCNYPGWVTDLLDEWDCGVSVPPGDAEAFATKLIELADLRNNLSRMGARARDLAKAEFDRDVLYKRLEALIESAFPVVQNVYP